MATMCVGDATGMRDDRQEMALRVSGDVPLAAFDPLARIVAALPPFCRVFTLWLSMIATVGSGSRPAWMRTWAPQVVMDRRPGPGVTQAPEGHGHRAPGRKILRQHPPWAATAFHVPDRIIQASRAVFAGLPDGLGFEKPFDLRPFPVARVARIPHRSVFLTDSFASLHGFVNRF